MNIAAHIDLASRYAGESNPEFELGSAIPDLVGMSGTRLVRWAGHRALSAGVEFHLATDRIFDSNPLFTKNKSEFFPQYNEIIPRGAARACANIGFEILLDGDVLKRSEAVDAYLEATETLRNRNLPLGKFALDSARFEKFIGGWSRVQVPWAYQDPEKVARIVHHRLMIYGSPRLMFDESKIPEVTEVFVRQQQAVSLVAGRILDMTLEQLPKDKIIIG